MDQPRRLPVWPFVLVCAVLFVLTLRAPHPWQRIAVPNAERILARRPARPYDDRALLRTVAPVAAQATVLSAVIQPEPPRQVVEPLPRVANRILPRREERHTLPVETPPEMPASPSPTAEASATPPAIVPETVPATPEVLTWPAPVNLQNDLEQLLTAPRLAPWANDVLAALATLQQAPALSSPESAISLTRLGQLAAAGEKLVEVEQNQDVGRHLRRTQYGLTRRLEIWQAAHAAAQRPQPRKPVVVERGQLANRAAVADAYFRSLDQGASWRQYTNLDAIRQLAESRAPQVADVAALAYITLGRLEEPSLSDAQNGVLAHPSILAVARELQKYLADPADLPQLLIRLEAFEQNGTSANSRALARTSQRLRWSTMPELRTVGERLELHYRNANLRVAVRGDLINRMLPVMQTMQEKVDDEILGAQVSGTSQVSSQLSARLIPDDRRLTFALQANGRVASETEASHGPVTFYNQGQANYVAEKVFRVDRLGIQSEAATARARTYNELTGMTSTYDNVPLVGAFVRNAAQKQHAAKRDQANYVAEQRVSNRVSSRLDEETRKRLEASEKRFRDKVLAPLVRLDLTPVPLELQTTSERMVSRCRFATDVQLGAHTPRPRALADSLLSVQVHESMLNNVIAQLKFDGRRVPLDELYRELAAATGRTATIPEDLPENVVVQFAAEDALRVRLTDGHLTVEIRLAELSQGKQNRWKNFTVRGHYESDGEQRTPTLVREGSIELQGERLGIRDQVALRGIFSKVLDKKKPIPLVDPRLLADARLANVGVTQLTLEHGWLGISLGPIASAPQRVANEKPAEKR